MEEYEATRSVCKVVSQTGVQEVRARKQRAHLLHEEDDEKQDGEHDHEDEDGPARCGVCRAGST